MAIPPPPKTQALSPTTKFNVPPLDGSLSLPEIYDWHAEHNAYHGLFVYATEDGTKRTISFKEGAAAFTAAGNFIHRLADGRPGEVVAILSPSESISYFTLIVGIMRANCIAFPISPRNSATAVAHLLKKVSVKHLLVGREQAMTDLANKAFEILLQEQTSVQLPTLSPMPVFEDLYHKMDNRSEKLTTFNRQSHEVAIYLHSSGSTAFPKPIPWTHRRVIEHSLTLWFGDRDQTDKVWSIAANPMYHGTGVLGAVWAVSCGITISVFEPKSPPQIPTPNVLFHSAEATESDIIFCVPSFMEAWSHRPEYVKWLGTRDGVVWGGAPLNKQIGDYLVSQGISLFTLFGATETGSVTPLIPATVDDWQYFPISRWLTVEMVPYDKGSNTYEVVMVTSPYSRPSVINTKILGQDAYATSDLLVPHPTKPGLWRVHGRTDDQIMHNTGEKTNPGPLENLMNQHPKVLSSVMFGRGKFQAGIVVDPKPGFKFDPADMTKLAEFRNDLWPTVEKMNDYAPQHSRLFKEMIIVSKPSKPFTYTAKNTARRQAIINDYAEEIEQVYALVDESTQSTISAPASWDKWSTLDFVRNVVQQALRARGLQDEQDIFERGCDSLQATWIRNSILRALRESAELDTRKTTTNFVYNCPTISSLSAFVLQVARGEDEPDRLDENHKILEMLALVKKYSSDLPAPQTSALFKTSCQHDVVILTGSTGAIGSQILVALALDSNVRKIYALNRMGGKPSLKDRHIRAFKARGLPLDVLDLEKVTLLEVDFTEEYLGLVSEVYEEMQSTVTSIIHNAWRVDFNLALKSFESNIRGTRTLIDFALKSKLLPTFLFVSSIGVLRNTTQLARPILEEGVPAAVAVGMGYSESKWVGETMLEEVRKSSGLPTLIIRVGQVTGASNGAWNPKEWFPSLVQASSKLGCLPDFDSGKVVSWIPAKYAGEAIANARHVPPETTFVHLVHPRPVPWKIILQALSSDLQLDVTPYSDWLQRLEVHCSEHPSELNASNLLPFFQSIADGRAWDKECFGLPRLDATQALRVMKCLNSPTYHSLGKVDVASWIDYLRRSGSL